MESYMPNQDLEVRNRVPTFVIPHVTCVSTFNEQLNNRVASNHTNCVWLGIPGVYIISSISKVKTQQTFLQAESKYFKIIRLQYWHQISRISLENFRTSIGMNRSSTFLGDLFFFLIRASSSTMVNLHRHYELVLDEYCVFFLIPYMYL